MADPKLLNNPEDAVREMLEGFVALHPHASLLDALDEDIKVVVHNGAKRDQVAVISGGGSGHEPAFAGYVGPGMLAAAVCGSVFASPSSEAVLQAIRTVSGKAGCLIVLMNYTGDRLNFGLAAEAAKAEGIPVELVVVADDCGVASVGIAGCRGIAGAPLVLKVAGALAARGASLSEVATAASASAKAVATMGASLSHCSLPGAPPASTESALPVGKMELGLGIHGEPGARRCDVMTADATVDTLLESILPAEHRAFKAGDSVAVVINNLGCSSTMEMMVVARRVLSVLADRRVKVERALVGTYLTALNMAGVSLSLMHVDAATLSLLDAPTAAPAWPRSLLTPAIGRPLVSLATSPVSADASATADTSAPSLTSAGSFIKGAVAACAKACVAAEADLTKYDTLAGDGDCGTTMLRGGQAVLAALDAIPFDDLSPACLRLAAIVAKNMGGTSGALYQIFFTAAAARLQGQQASSADVADVAEALSAGVSAICKYGGAAAGDRSMVDALLPAAQAALAHVGEGPVAAAMAASKAAQRGADATKTMKARAGRSSYVNEDSLQGVPDPGAHAVGVWFRVLEEHFSSAAVQ